MATGGVPKKSSTSKAEGRNVKLFFTSYTDDFFAERELFKREVSAIVVHFNTFSNNSLKKCLIHELSNVWMLCLNKFS